MIIKKFTAKDSRAAMAKIRKEFGPDAILLSSKEVGDQFEMVASPKYDDQDIEQEIALQHQMKREQDIKQELSSLYAKDQQSLKVLQDEMAQMRSLIESQLERDKILLESMGQRAEPLNRVSGNMVAGYGGHQAYQQPLAHNPAVQQAVATQPIPHPPPQAAPAYQQEAVAQDAAQQHIDQYLADIGISRRLRESLQRRIQGIQELETASSKTMQILSGAVRELDVASLPESGVAAFVGAPGSGKTTALIKLAQKHRKHFGVDDVGFILLDQKYLRKHADANLLIKYADAMGIPYLYADTPRQLLSAAKKLADKKLLLIDSSGSKESLPMLHKSLQALSAKCPKLMTFMALAAQSNRVDQERAVKAYGQLASATVVTKTKEARHLGALVELLIRKKIPLGYISATAKLDASIIQGSSEQLIRMALDLGRLPKENNRQASHSHYSQNTGLASGQSPMPNGMVGLAS